MIARSLAAATSTAPARHRSRARQALSLDQLRAIATARLEGLQGVSDDDGDTGRPGIDRAPGGLGMDELQAMAVRRQLDIGAVVEPIAAPPRTQRQIDRETMMEAVGLCLAETETRAANALQRLRSEMERRIATLEQQAGESPIK